MNTYKNWALLGTDLLSTENDITSLCENIPETALCGLSVLPLYLKTAHEALGNKQLPLIAIVGYPYGHSAIEAKLAEMVLALVDGATVVQFVINHIAIRNNDWKYVANELNHLQLIASNKQVKLQAFIIPSILTNEALQRCCDLYGIAGLDAVVISTDDLSELDALASIKFIRLHLTNNVKLGVSGHIKTINFAEDIIKSEVDFIQTSNYEKLLQQYQNA